MTHALRAFWEAGGSYAGRDLIESLVALALIVAVAAFARPDQ